MENSKPKSIPRYRGAQKPHRSFRNNPSHFNYSTRPREIQDSSNDMDTFQAATIGYSESSQNRDEQAAACNITTSVSLPTGTTYDNATYNSEFNNYQSENSHSKASHKPKTPENFSKEDQMPKVNKMPTEKTDKHGSIVGGRYIRKRYNNNNSLHFPQNNEQRFCASKMSTNKNNTNFVGLSEQKYGVADHQSFENDSSFPQEYKPTNHRYDKSTHYFRNTEHQNSYHNVGLIKDTQNQYFSSNRTGNGTYRTDLNSKMVRKGNYQCLPDGEKSKFSQNPPKEILNTKSYRAKNSNVFPKTGICKDDATQRERLMHHLHQGDLECLVCCDHIRIKDQVWHCISCFHIFHLRCIRKWARSPAAIMEDGTWRCPACQNLSKTIPFDYLCFCGKNKDPEVDYHSTPHSCGEICGRSRGENCPHRCNLLCHPGPCPPCSAVLQKSCACGKTVKATPCNQVIDPTCDSICGKILNCSLHECASVCHVGPCASCELNICQTCFCGKSERQVPCHKDTLKCENYSCGEICGKKLSCSHHDCDLFCHFGTCKPCSLLPEYVTTCPCKKVTLKELVASGTCNIRKSCLDPIPVCGQKCGKPLLCGPKENPHLCESDCHTGPCPPCPLSTSMKCRCGSFHKEFPCADIVKTFVYLCEKRCNRRKDCSRHKCLNLCCVNIEHKCELVCNKKLSCGMHQCQETCHMGKCPTCWNVSFDELHCHCGTAVLFPPIHCGTKPPECSEPCSRSHPCDHKVQHNCHSEDTCPPCTFLTAKWCFGHHKQCGNVQCFMDGISCGQPCLMPLPCGNHKCQKTCHPSPCFKNDTKCVQPCETIRPSCGHPCGVACHEGPCPESSCKAQVNLVCPCGHRSETSSCSDSIKSYRLMSVTVLASKMQDIKEGQSVNIGDVLGKKMKNNRLQCNEECALIERNKRLAIALQIQNPDLSCSPGPPNYSEFLKEETRKNPSFVSDIYDKITELVQLAKQSKQKCRSHSFPPMNRDHRRIVHELAEFFGCETQSYDEEPKKNVVVTAHKTKCWLPFASVITIVQKETGIRLGIRKGPAPVPLQRNPKPATDSNVATSIQKKKIDYFDFTQ